MQEDIERCQRDQRATASDVARLRSTVATQARQIAELYALIRGQAADRAADRQAIDTGLVSVGQTFADAHR
ncbi:hypothetical protein J8F10_29720 [Gemmata sp. G18]|uniref:Uncharacterized protein n=1 Tax=Gemmata palustris TaxID=2822762 RepID=A0ABS5C2S8_9BACT|nr:hypothetical protein [Gemmata palustris]MBP3959443.1 hypothetical protein [Gemmata palustris]